MLVKYFFKMSVNLLYFYFSTLLVCNFVYCDTPTVFHNASTTEMVESISINCTQEEALATYESFSFFTNENFTFYDRVFWGILSSFIVYVIYIRFLSHFRIDYPDESGSPFISAIISFRKMVAPDPYLDKDMRKLHELSSFENGPLIAFWISWYCLSLFSLDELFGVTNVHIEGLRQLIITLFIYSINIVGVCVVFDICVTAPMQYYEK